jgi:hypothetical protein
MDTFLTGSICTATVYTGKLMYVGSCNYVIQHFYFKMYFLNTPEHYSKSREFELLLFITTIYLVTVLCRSEQYSMNSYGSVVGQYLMSQGTICNGPF